MLPLFADEPGVWQWCVDRALVAGALLACALFVWVCLGVLEVISYGEATFFADLFWLFAGIPYVLGRMLWRVFGVRQRLRMFALNWRHRRDQRLIESLHLMPAERDALLLDAARRFMKAAGEIVHGG